MTLETPKFSDIQGHWAQPCIERLAQEKLVSGYPGEIFRPDAPVTRAEFAVLMCNRFPDSPPVKNAAFFKDVSENHWAANAIKTASEKGFFAGYPDGTFKPDQAIPRVQAIIVLAAHLKLRVPESPQSILKNNFIDSEDIPNYALEMMAAATMGALVINYPNKSQLNPNQNATRGEVAALLCRTLQIYVVPPQYIAGVESRPQEVRALPGELNKVPTFNSNSPELVRTEGILLSTFPTAGKQVSEAHLDFTFEGRFDIFSHHITRAESEAERRTFYQGLILYNPGNKSLTIEVLEAASYLGTPDAPFIELPDAIDNPDARVYSGPGSRTMTEVLFGFRQAVFADKFEIAPNQYALLMSLPIPIFGVPASNGRTTMMRLLSSRAVYIANLAMKAPLNGDGSERAPTLSDWIELLEKGGLAGPRDRPPTPLETEGIKSIVFSRVAGVSQGTRWQTNITENPEETYLKIPDIGQEFSYAISTLHKVTLGTGQVQSAPMLVRYPDTAYYAHANYGIEYNVTLPLYNWLEQNQTVTVTFSSPLKDSEPNDKLLFLKIKDRVFFRGTVRVRYEENGLQTRTVHLVQRRGQQGEALVTLNIPPSTTKKVELDFLYPPDCTPPQAITITTIA